MLNFTTLDKIEIPPSNLKCILKTFKKFQVQLKSDQSPTIFKSVRNVFIYINFYHYGIGESHTQFEITPQNK